MAFTRPRVCGVERVPAYHWNYRPVRTPTSPLSETAARVRGGVKKGLAIAFGRSVKKNPACPGLPSPIHNERLVQSIRHRAPHQAPSIVTNNLEPKLRSSAHLT